MLNSMVHIITTKVLKVKTRYMFRPETAIIRLRVNKKLYVEDKQVFSMCKCKDI